MMLLSDPISPVEQLQNVWMSESLISTLRIKDMMILLKFDGLTCHVFIQMRIKTITDSVLTPSLIAYWHRKWYLMDTAAVGIRYSLKALKQSLTDAVIAVSVEVCAAGTAVRLRDNVTGALRETATVRLALRVALELLSRRQRHPRSVACQIR